MEFMSDPRIQQTRPYHVPADLIIENPRGAGNPTNYSARSIPTPASPPPRVTANGIDWRREVFVSHSANAIVVHLTSSTPSGHRQSEVAATQLRGLRLPVRPAGRGFRHPLRRPPRQAHRRHIPLPSSFTPHQLQELRDVSADPAQRNAATLAAIAKELYETLRAETHPRTTKPSSRRVSPPISGATPAANLPHLPSVSPGSHHRQAIPHWSYTALPVRPGPHDRGQPPERPAHYSPKAFWNDSNKPAWDSKVHRQTSIRN